jgi:hypothetical protein
VVRKALLAGVVLPLLAVGALQLSVGSKAEGATHVSVSRADKQRAVKALGSMQRLLKKQARPAAVAKDLNWLKTFAAQHKNELNGAFQRALNSSNLSPARKKALLARVNKLPNGFAGVIQRGVDKALQQANSRSAVRPAISSNCISDLIKLAAAITQAVQNGNWGPVISLLPGLVLECAF